jgi:hypothetical protein
MSNFVTEHESIVKSPLNNSKSKYLYSFAKSVRFPDQTKLTSNHQFYNISNWKNNRSASIGLGTKYDFTKENKDKCQAFYDIGSTFDPKKKSEAPSYTFGLGRSYFEKVYYETNKTIDKNIPGPCKYDVLKPFGTDSLKFSISSKFNIKDGRDRSKEPGPGEYKSIGINSSGRFPISTYQNSPSCKFSLNKEERFNYSKMTNKNPGPEKYNLSNIQVLSTFHSPPKARIIGKGHDLTSKYTNKQSKLFSLYFILFSSRTRNI